ncbi:hypothetical protein VaNZ11_007607 [Volvox africanus]|uniref:Methyltransferase domain-containing protein n=1 Tax=Volvox africanus TaxID=51714 RepID=A0ABQ5S4K2_9CHLO|nr:hypothetical protein VaNZ11_007607 [Volvox africanus]
MSTSDFTVGEIVDVRNYGRAEVVEPIVTEAGSRFYGRIRIKYQCDGKTYYARPENLRKTVQVKQRVLLCHSTTHYRTCAASVVNWNDAVLEVGSHEGECTRLLSRRCRYIVGVDKSPATIAAARRRYPELRFEEVDGFDVPMLKALGPPDGSGFSVVLVDIGGIASLSTVAALVGLYYKEFPFSTKIVVKSVFLKRLVEDCLPYNTEKSNPWALLHVGGGAEDNGVPTSGSGSTGVGGTRSVHPDPDSHTAQTEEAAEAEEVEEEAEEHVEGAGEGPAARMSLAKEGFGERLQGGVGRGAGRMAGSSARGTEESIGQETGPGGEACG